MSDPIESESPPFPELHEPPARLRPRRRPPVTLPPSAPVARVASRARIIEVWPPDPAFPGDVAELRIYFTSLDARSRLTRMSVNRTAAEVVVAALLSLIEPPAEATPVPSTDSTRTT